VTVPDPTEGLDPDIEVAIAAEGDPITRATEAFAYVGRLGLHLDRMTPTDRAMARDSGEVAWVGGQQRVHTQLAAASAQLAIALELRALRELAERIADALGAGGVEALPPYAAMTTGEQLDHLRVRHFRDEPRLEMERLRVHDDDHDGAQLSHRHADTEPTYRDPHEPPGAAQDWRG
jgi:hypothetical protein